MRLTKLKLRQIIKEEKIKFLKEQPRPLATAMGHTSIQPGDEGMHILMKLEELEETLAGVRNPEDWAERYPRSLQGFLDSIDRVVVVLEKMS